MRQAWVTVDPHANAETGDEPADLAALEGHARTLAEGIEAALPAWVERAVLERWRAWRAWQEPGADPVPPPELVVAAREAGEAARREVGPRVRALLETDVDGQRTNPLAVVREAVVHPTRVLVRAGVPPVVRDEQAERLFPDDAYDLTPGAFADVDPALHEPGLVWGAAKAHVVLARRRQEGLR
jgi:hypothetical protein